MESFTTLYNTFKDTRTTHLHRGSGTNAGKYLVESLEKHSLPILVGLAGLLICFSIVAVVCRKVLKMNILNIMGLLSGAMTSTPSLTMANNITKTDYPSSLCRGLSSRISCGYRAGTTWIEDDDHAYELFCPTIIG